MTDAIRSFPCCIMKADGSNLLITCTTFYFSSCFPACSPSTKWIKVKNTNSGIFETSKWSYLKLNICLYRLKKKKKTKHAYLQKLSFHFSGFGMEIQGWHHQWCRHCLQVKRVPFFWVFIYSTNTVFLVNCTEHNGQTITMSIPINTINATNKAEIKKNSLITQKTDY